MLSRFSRVRLFVTLSIVALQAPLCMGFSRQEYQSGLPCPPPRDPPDPGIELESPAVPALQADYLLLTHPGSPLVFLYSNISNILMFWLPVFFCFVLLCFVFSQKPLYLLAPSLPLLNSTSEPPERLSLGLKSSVCPLSKTQFSQFITSVNSRIFVSAPISSSLQLFSLVLARTTVAVV